MVSYGDLLMTAAGSVGKSIRFTESYPACYAGFLVRLRPRSTDTGRYIAYWMQSVDYWDQIAVGSVKSTIENFSASRYRALQVPLPALNEQRAIVDHLDHETAQIDALVTKQEELIGLLQERRASTIDSLVWSGLDRTAEVVNAGIGPDTLSPRHWSILRNKNLFREISVLSKDGQEELLTVSHLTGVTPRSMKNVNMFEAVTTEGYKVVEVGDLAINTMWAWMGALGVSKYRGLASPAYGVYRPIVEGMEGRYFDHLFRTPRYVIEMTRHSRGVTASRLRLYPDSFLRLSVVVPPLSEQRTIVAHIDEQTTRIDALVSKAKEHIALAKERRSALITAAVTGQFDVRTAHKGT
jgi:type I restriction enzyme S subunit